MPLSSGGCEEKDHVLQQLSFFQGSVPGFPSVGQLFPKQGRRVFKTLRHHRPCELGFGPTFRVFSFKSKIFLLFSWRGRQRKASFKSKMVNRVISDVSHISEVYGFATGQRSSGILLTSLRSCTIQYDPSGFQTDKMGVLNSDGHSFNNPNCKQFSTIGLIPSLPSIFKGKCLILFTELKNRGTVFLLQV